MGDAAGWIDTLDYLNTGRGEEPNIAIATGPPLLLHELAAELDEPEVPSPVGEVRTRDILAGGVGTHPGTDPAERQQAPRGPPDVDCVEEYVEGYRSAAPLVGHMPRGDIPAREMLLHRSQDSPSLARGAAAGLADIAVGAARLADGDSATELLHHVHATATGAQAYAQPLHLD